MERIAYEFCEDQSLCGVLYFEVRYSPHELCTTDLEQPEEKLVLPRDIVEAVNRGLKRGEHDFGVIARSILCCMRHMPGKIDKFVYLIIIQGRFRIFLVTGMSMKLAEIVLCTTRSNCMYTT